MSWSPAERGSSARTCAERCWRRPEVTAVTVLDDLSTGNLGNLEGIDGRVDFFQGSVLHRDLLDGADRRGADAIVHLAARAVGAAVGRRPRRRPRRQRHRHAARAGGGPPRRRACTRSSRRRSSVYGDTAVLPKHEDLPTNPLSPYAASKLAAEGYATAYAASYDLPVLTFRFFNVFGPLQPAHHAYAAVIPAFVTAALAGRPLPIYGDGTQTRDFTSVHTVCAVLTRALVEGTTAPGRSTSRSAPAEPPGGRRGAGGRARPPAGPRAPPRPRRRRRALAGGPVAPQAALPGPAGRRLPRRWPTRCAGSGVAPARPSTDA